MRTRRKRTPTTNNGYTSHSRGPYPSSTPPGRTTEEINDIWGFVIQLVQYAYQEQDIYLVACMRGVGTILRDRPSDKD